MKTKRMMLAVAAALAMTGARAANDCNLDIMVIAPDAEKCDITEATAQKIADRLVRALSFDGVTADETYGQIYLSARLSHSYKETVPGPPQQTAVRTDLTVFVADVIGNRIFASETFELRGVGSSEQRAFVNALSSLNAGNKALEKFVATAKTKTIAYFDKNYRSILAQADQAAAMRQYDRALYYSTLVPPCSAGYAEASNATLNYYQQLIDFEGQQLLTEAQGIFAAEPNQAGAAKAFALIARIDPAAACYKNAMKFAEEVKRQAKAEYDFENHQKYNDAVDMRRRMIDAAKAVGVAYGQGQAANTTNLLWH